MGINLADYQLKTREAIKFFWKTREEARQKNIQHGTLDQGERGSVTAGKNMNAFLDLMKDIVILNGLKQAEIFFNQQLLILPGYFRPAKKWDMVIINDGRLVAVIELKSQVGPSFGNNCNNRTEEAIGSAVDLWTAYREKAFGEIPRPFLGWILLLEDCDKSRSIIHDNTSHYQIFPDFNNTSYADRYNILCKKLIQEQLYTSASLLLSPRSAIASGEYNGLSDLTGFSNFVTTFAGHCAIESARS